MQNKKAKLAVRRRLSIFAILRQEWPDFSSELVVLPFQIKFLCRQEKNKTVMKDITLQKNVMIEKAQFFPLFILLESRV